jgi:hypothetical protein
MKRSSSTASSGTTKSKKPLVQTNTLFNYFESKNPKIIKENVKIEPNTITNYFKLEKPIDNVSIKEETLSSETPKQSFLTSKTEITEKENNDSIADSTSETSSNNIRKCPFYKRIEGTQCCVDAFSYGDIENCNAYFLSHYHYDHFIGLNRKFQNQLYCSKITANLVSKHIKVEKKYINVLEYNKFLNVYNDSSSVQVALIDANQYLYLFEHLLNYLYDMMITVLLAVLGPLCFYSN